MRRFFFAPESPRILALMRIGLAIVLLGEVSYHWPFAVELYSQAGLPIPVFPQTWFEPPVPSATGAIALESLLIFSLLLVGIGWKVRTALWAACLLTLWLGLLDFPGTFAKYSAIALHLLVLLGCSRCGAVWSLEAWRRRANVDQCPLGPAWPRRLIQILVCSVYFGAAVTKLQNPDFVSGDLLTYSLLDDRWGGVDAGIWMASHPRWMIGCSIGTMLFELLFPFLVWVRPLRGVLLGAALLFHIVTGFVMRLGIFSPVMFVALLAFLDQRDLDGLMRRLSGIGMRKGREESPGPSASSNGAPKRFEPWEQARPTTIKSRVMEWGVTVICGASFCAAGVALQRSADWYGVFHQHSLDPLPEVSAGDAAEMLAGQRLQEADYLQRVEIGERFNGNRVYGARERFRRGMRVYVLIQLIQPHPSLAMEGLLLAPDGQEVARFSAEVGPPYTYAIKGFELTDTLPEGRYRILLQANGYEVAQKEFELVP